MAKGKRQQGHGLYRHKRRFGDVVVEGSWIKNVNGRREYFGTDLAEAIKRYGRLISGEAPRLVGRRPATGRGAKASTVIEDWLEAKQRRAMMGTLSRTTYRNYADVAKLLIAAVGNRREGEIGPEFWARLYASWSERFGLTRLNALVIWTRSVFTWAQKSNKWRTPMLFGPDWVNHKVPEDEQKGRGLGVDAIRRLLKLASGQDRAWILLGINCAFGPADVVNLRIEHVDLVGGWISHKRKKTGAQRTCALWPETVDALGEAIGKRTSGLVWLAMRKSKSGRLNASTVQGSFDRLSAAAHLRRRSQVGFYGLRRDARTLADPARDAMACDLMMGHVTPGMGPLYTQTIEPERVRRVAGFIRDALVESHDSVL